MRTYIADIPKHEGEEVELMGWAETVRSHGKIVFIDLRDRSGIVQVVLTPDQIGDAPLATESVVRIGGLVKKRPPKMVNEKLQLGAYEIEGRSFANLNPTSSTPNIPVDTDGYGIGEEVRMKYRYADLRRKRMRDNLELRHRIIKFIRDYLDEHGFWEIETPNLTKSTPEGARDYLVPSRIEPGKFYAMPQSPQQYKQLLMVGGIEKYFQIARCFRDEDTRGDRQPEFTQLDMEMSFVEREDVMALNEDLLIKLVQTVAPEKKIQEIPFPRITYTEAMAKYGTDRPDLRNDKNDPNLLAFCWVIDFPFFEGNSDSKSGWTFTHNPFSAAKPEYIEKVRDLGNPKTEWGTLKNNREISEVLTTQYDIALNGWEIGGGSIRNHNADDLLAVFKVIGYDADEVEKKFGHMLTALRSGAPPHGGIAWGLDRLMMILRNEPNIREVIAFPKSGDGHDFMMDAPSDVDPKQLKELGIEVKKQTK